MELNLSPIDLSKNADRNVKEFPGFDDFDRHTRRAIRAVGVGIYHSTRGHKMGISAPNDPPSSIFIHRFIGTASILAGFSVSFVAMQRDSWLTLVIALIFLSYGVLLRLLATVGISMLQDIARQQATAALAIAEKKNADDRRDRPPLPNPAGARVMDVAEFLQPFGIIPIRLRVDESEIKQTIIGPDEIIPDNISKN